MESPPHIAPPDDAPDTPNRPAINRLAEAVIAVAKRPSRAAYATWMQVVEPEWILPMLALAGGLYILNGVISLLIGAFLMTPNATSARYQFGPPSPPDFLIFYIVISPLLYLTSFALLMFLVARLMPAERGTLQQRVIQVARAYLLEEIVTSLITLLVNQPVSILRNTGLGHNPLVNAVAGAIEVATAIYFFIAVLNALAAGSGRSRWLLFAIWILSALAPGALIWYGLGALLSLVGIHLPVSALW